jgi:hypothetical protein
MLELLLIVIVAIGLFSIPFFFVNELMKKDETILAWQKAYTELATENELRKLGVMK